MTPHVGNTLMSSWHMMFHLLIMREKEKNQIRQQCQGMNTFLPCTSWSTQS